MEYDIDELVLQEYLKTITPDPNFATAKPFQGKDSEPEANFLFEEDDMSLELVPHIPENDGTNDDDPTDNLNWTINGYKVNSEQRVPVTRSRKDTSDNDEVLGPEKKIKV